jgi:outer membrane receptor protein involved in Fe transport
MKKKIFVALCLLWGLCVVQAEDKKGAVIQLKGHVMVEGSNEDVPYVTVTVQDDSAQVITRQASDGSGRFTVTLKQAGSYELILSAVGYQTETRKVSVDEGETSRNLGNIAMKEGVELKEVSVTVQKPLIKSDPDKLIYSVEADPEAKSNTALEIIRKVPLLTVDAEDNVTLNGQSNYKVLVNGKSSSLMSNNFKEVIKSMPASSIKDIEVITNPSSKYEAEGVGGIINIITIKNKTNGYTGSVGGNVDSRGGYGANAYVSANIEKFSFSTNLFNYHFRQPTSEGASNRVNHISEEFRYTDSKSKNKYTGNGNSVNFEAGYEIDTLNLISASGWGYFGNYSFDNIGITEDRNVNNIPVRRYQNQMDGTNGYGYLSGNVDYQRSFAKKDKTFTTSYKLDYNPNNTRNESSVDGELNYASYRQKSDNRASGQTHTFQLDYYDPLTEAHQVETGVKGIYRRNFSETDLFVFDQDNDRWEEDLSRLNDLDYNQYIVGAYAGYLFKHKKISTKVGGRAEYTRNDGIFKSQQNTDFQNSFFNFIPYLNFTYALKPSQTVKMSYTQRLFRPGIWALNPYVNDLNPMDISYGNPKLDAEISHSFSASYGQFAPKFNFNIDLNGSITNNSVQNYSFITPEGVRHSTYGNIGSNQRYGANLYASIRPTPKLNFYLNGRANYVFLDSNNEMNHHNEGFTGGGSFGGRLTLWKGSGLSANAGGGLPWIMLQGKSNGYYYTSLGLSQKLLKEKLDVSVYISDPFSRKIYYRSDFDDPTYTMHTENFRWGQTLRLNIVYRFGKMDTQVKKARRSITNDDQRSGEGQEGGGAQGGGGQ